MGGDHRRDAGGARTRTGPGRDARTATVRPRRRPRARCTTPARRSRRTTWSPSIALRRGSWSTPARRPRRSFPLMERTIANDFELTGPLARGDATTVERHLAAIRVDEPGLEPLYTALAEATPAVKVVERIAEVACRAACGARHRRPGADDGRPARRPRSAVSRRPAGLRRARREPVRQPGAVLGAQRSRRRIRATSPPTRRPPSLQASTCSSRRPSTRCTRRDSPPGSSRRRRSAGSRAHRPGHFRGVATVVPQALQHPPARARVVRPQGRPAGRRAEAAGSRSRPRASRSASSRPCATTTASRSPRATRGCRRPSGRSQPRFPRALATRDEAAGARCSTGAGIEPEYVAVANLDGPTLAVAARVGSTRLIDNVLLEGDSAMSTRPRTPAAATPAPGEAAAPRARGDETPRRPDRDDHRLRRSARRGSPTMPASS